ncbi:MAG: hypothetical protein ABIW79_01290, partial [Gemmatimonas sp.]
MNTRLRGRSHWWAHVSAAIAFALLFISSFVLVPAPTRFLLPLGVGAPELSGQLALASFVVLVLSARRWRTANRFSRAAAVMSALALILCLPPLLQFRSTARAARAELDRAFGHDAGGYTSGNAARMRPRALHVEQLFTGLDHDAARESHAVPFAARGDETLTMEIYQADDRSPYPGTRPVIVQVYGGAWQRGEPSDFAGFARYFAARGYVV